MGIVRIPHVVGGNKIVQLEDVYGSIGTVCGITKLVGTPPDGAESVSIRGAIANGTIRRAVARVGVDGAVRNRVVYMAAANAAQVGALAGQTYTTGQTIKSAYFKQQITLY